MVRADVVGSSYLITRHSLAEGRPEEQVETKCINQDLVWTYVYLAEENSLKLWKQNSVGR